MLVAGMEIKEIITIYNSNNHSIYPWSNTISAVTISSDLLKHIKNY